MGFSVTISHAILLIASIIIASSFAIAVIAKTSVFSSIFSQNINQYTLNSQIDFTIIYSYFDNGLGAFVIFVKNTGLIDISDAYLSKADVYLISNGKAQLLSYGPSPGQWTYRDTNGVGGWQVGETIVLTARNETPTDLRVIVKLALPNGYSKDSLVWLGG